MTLFEFKDFDIFQARYIILKELDLRGPIGELLLRKHHNLLHETSELFAMIESSMNPESGMANAEPLPLEYLYTMEHVTCDLPSLMLSNEGIAIWGDFVNAWLTLMDNAIALHQQLVENMDGPEIDRVKEAYYKVLDDIRFGIGSAVRLVEFGISYHELMLAGKRLLDEMNTWHQARPVSLQLSDAYLEALKFD